MAVSCDRPTATVPSRTAAFDPDELARIGEHSLRRAEFEAALERRARGRSGAFARAEDRAALLEELVTQEAIYQRALASGFAQRPEVVRQIKRFVVEQYRATELPADPGLPEVDDEEIDRAYREQLDRFTTPEKVRFAVIQFGWSPKAEEERKVAVARQAGSVLAEARTAGDDVFSELARRHSEHQATRYRGGDAGWVSRDEGMAWPLEVIHAAFSLKQPGELGPVIIADNGCYLVRLIARQPAGHRPPAEVRAALHYELAVRKRDRLQQEFAALMKAGVSIEINHALLECIPAPNAPAVAGTPPALPVR